MSFAVLRSNATEAAVLTAAAASSYSTARLSQYQSFPSQMTHPGIAFTEPLMRHLEHLHREHNSTLGLPATGDKHVVPRGTVQLRWASDMKPPPDFDRKNQEPCVSADGVGLSTQHTDRAKADQPGFFPELFDRKGPLYVPPDAAGNVSSSTDDDDAGEHTSYTDTATTWRAVVNCGGETVSMYVSLPKYDNGVHVASRSPTGVHEQFQWQEFELKPGDVFAFQYFAGVVLKHQAGAAKLASGVCFAVFDYGFEDGARDVHSLVAPVPTPAPWPWQGGWRTAPQSAHSARSEWAGNALRDAPQHST